MLGAAAASASAPAAASGPLVGSGEGAAPSQCFMVVRLYEPLADSERAALTTTLMAPRKLSNDIRVGKLSALFRMVRAMPHYAATDDDPLAVAGQWLSPMLWA